MKTKIVLIGKGNVATHLKAALEKQNFPVSQVNSRTLENIPDGDVYIFSVKDDALPEVLEKFPAKEGLFVHTAGSIPMDVFHGANSRYGVLYPLQTFSKNRSIDFDHIPLFIEANNQSDEDLLKTIAEAISSKVTILDSEKRKYLHLAAVYACNFVNHLYKLSAQILEEQDLSYDLLLPLIEETANKASRMHPKDAQTGPAARSDKKTMDRHLDLLPDGDIKEIYRLLSRSISADAAMY